MHIQSKDLHLTLSVENGTFELESPTFPGVSLHSQFEVACQFEGKNINLLERPWSIQHIEEQQTKATRFAKLITANLLINTVVAGLDVIVRVGLTSDEAMAFIQIEIINQSKSALKIKRITPLMINPGDLHLCGNENHNSAFYSNGWQSWSSTGTYGLGDKQLSSILGRFQNPMVINPGTPQPKRRNHFSADMFCVLGDRDSRVGLLAGFMSQKAHFGSLEARFKPEPSLMMWANGDDALVPPGEMVQTDWAVLTFIDLDAPEPMAGYFNAVAREHEIHSQKPIPVGWCSWYHFYQNITQVNIEANLTSVAALQSELPLSLLQIDDGFETYPGDWYDFDPGFPDGLQPLVRKTKIAGLTPGLWLAPYIVHPKANLVKDHLDWLLRDRKGKPVNAGFIWNTFTYALDLTNAEALEYTCDLIHTAVEDWGFEYLKLDFLYAAALKGVYRDPTRTRAQVLRQGLAALREAAGPNVTMLACGCPLGSALGLFEAMRISADVSGYWKPHFPPFSSLLQKEPHMPAARTALHNILTRAPLHRYWWINDPDCLLVRPDTDLTLAEVHTLATAIGLTGGSLLLSDDLPALTKDRLRIAQVLLPVMDQRARVMDWFDAEMPARLRLDLHGPAGDWHLLSQFNWHDHPVSLTFSPDDFKLQTNQVWWIREFWSGVIGKMKSDSPFIFHDVPAHGVRVVAARAFRADQPAYLGSDLHLSQGLEIKNWQEKECELSLQFEFGREASSSLDFYLPWQPAGVWFKGKSQMMRDRGHNVFSVDLENLDGQTLHIRG